MHVEAHYTGKDENYVDRMVAIDVHEDLRLEVAFMVGAGVNCGRTATDYSDPLQQSFPRTYSVEATETIIKGLYKAMDGPQAGYWNIGRTCARKLLARTLLSRQTIVPYEYVDPDKTDSQTDYWKNYGQHNNAN